jgi:hypothetical protein
MAPLSDKAAAGLNSSTMFLLCSQAISAAGRVRALLAELEFSTGRISTLAWDEIPL